VRCDLLAHSVIGRELPVLSESLEIQKDLPKTNVSDNTRKLSSSCILLNSPDKNLASQSSFFKRKPNNTYLHEKKLFLENNEQIRDCTSQIKKEETNENLLELQELIEFCQKTNQSTSEDKAQNSTNLKFEQKSQDRSANDYLLESMDLA
jgi:hypothetical protein